MKKAILVAIIGAMTLGVNAGDWGKAPVIDKAPIEECYDIGGEVTVGYMSDYIFYGVRQARDTVWTDVNYTFDSLWAPINIGASYYNGTDGFGFEELDLYASVEVGSYGGVDASLYYTHYFYPGVSTNSYGEVGLDLGYSLGFADLSWRSGFGIDFGWYHEAGIERAFGITDNVSLVLGAGLGYTDGYNAGLSSWNHYYVNASLPIELNCRATLTPYVGYNGGPNGYAVDGIGTAYGPQSDILHGGVSLSVSF
jgi:hypothetical protein